MGIGKVADIWQGRPISKYHGNLDDLVNELPRFETCLFGEGISANQFLVQVVRLPMLNDPHRVPVGVVSHNYHLVQHADLISWLRRGLAKANVEEAVDQCTLFISTYGERIKLWIPLRGLEFNPGDGYPLGVVVACQNSVEGSCALEIKVIRVRWVCENGMILGPGGRIRKTHVPRLINDQEIAHEITYYLDQVADDQKILSRWLRSMISREQINHWVDTIVASKWGEKDAARVASICSSGNDGDVKTVKDWPPSQWQVGWDVIVPGAFSPANNLYHASQALSWVASRHPHLEVRSKRLEQISGMIAELEAVN